MTWCFECELARIRRSSLSMPTFMRRQHAKTELDVAIGGKRTHAIHKFREVWDRIRAKRMKIFHLKRSDWRDRRTTHHFVTEQMQDKESSIWQFRHLQSL